MITPALSEDAEEVLIGIADLSKASELSEQEVMAMLACTPGVKLGRQVRESEMAAKLGWPLQRLKRAIAELASVGFIRRGRDSDEPGVMKRRRRPRVNRRRFEHRSRLWHRSVLRALRLRASMRKRIRGLISPLAP